MKVIDPGHKYELAHLDGDGIETLTFVKREGDGYPGNIGQHEGTNIQEVLRALIHRVGYLHDQIPHWRNTIALDALRLALESLEFRAAERHGRILRLPKGRLVESLPTCAKCGHIGCAELSGEERTNG